MDISFWARCWLDYWPQRNFSDGKKLLADHNHAAHQAFFKIENRSFWKLQLLLRNQAARATKTQSPSSGIHRRLMA